MVSFSDDTLIFKADTIELEGMMWIVLEWLDNPKAGWRIPGKIICLDLLMHRKTIGGPTDFVLTDRIPKSVFYGLVPPPEGIHIVLRDGPDIPFPAIGG